MREWIDKRLGGGEAGLTMIEVLVAAVVLVMGAAATFGILGAATRNAQRAKATQVALDLAQEEMERLHSIPYEELAVNVMPTFSNDPQSPNSRMNSGSFALKRGNPNEAYFPVDVNAEAGFSPESEFFTGDTEHGGIKGTLYRYVVWRNDPSCTTEACEKSEQDYKQIVVAVKPDRPVSQGGESGYVEVQSAVTAPPDSEQTPQEIEEEAEKHEKEEKEKENGGPSGGGADVTAQQFYLSDTSCSSTGSTVRQEITGDHLLHNTLGTCASGLQTGSENPGAPDTLLLAGAPDLYPEDETLPHLYDYSDDFYLEPTPDTDKGVQIRRDDTAGCHYEPTGTTNPESQVHRWVTDPLPEDFEMGGKATLEFYTRTLNDALYTGRLCVYLFVREDIGNGEEEDTMLIDKDDGNPYWTYEPEGNGYWPRNSWAKIRLTMEFQGAPKVLEEGRRLGVALSVDRADTPADAIPIMYDHPNYPTRLEVDTKTPFDVASGEEEAGGEVPGG
jgi:hypothetical protein